MLDAPRSTLSSMDRDQLVARARALAPRLLSAAAQTEEARRVSDETVNAFAAEGLFRILQPKRVGGHELDMRALIDITIEIARGCPSSGWVYAIGASHAYMVSLFPAEAQGDVWRDETDVFVAGSYAPACRAERTADGFRISGSWPFASGVDNAKWAVVGALIPGAPGEPPLQPAFLLLPSDCYSIDDDWFTTGLCGTGSKQIVIDSVTVPFHRRLNFADALAGTSPGAVVNQGPLYRLPFIATTPVGLISTALGAVQGAIDEFVDSIAVRSTRGAALGAGASIAQFSAVQTRFAEATACLDAAKLLLYRSIDDAMACVRRGERIDVAGRIRNRRDHAFAVKLAEQAMAALDSVAGGRGLYRRSILQRAWRDVHAVGKHVSFNWDAVGSMYGQHAFGLEAKGQY